MSSGQIRPESCTRSAIIAQVTQLTGEDRCRAGLGEVIGFKKGLYSIQGGLLLLGAHKAEAAGGSKVNQG